MSFKISSPPRVELDFFRHSFNRQPASEVCLHASWYKRRSFHTAFFHSLHLCWHTIISFFHNLIMWFICKLQGNPPWTPFCLLWDCFLHVSFHPWKDQKWSHLHAGRIDATFIQRASHLKLSKRDIRNHVVMSHWHTPFGLKKVTMINRRGWEMVQWLSKPSRVVVYFKMQPIESSKWNLQKNDGYIRGLINKKPAAVFVKPKQKTLSFNWNLWKSTIVEDLVHLTVWWGYKLIQRYQMVRTKAASPNCFPQAWLENSAFLPPLFLFLLEAPASN